MSTAESSPKVTVPAGPNFDQVVVTEAGGLGSPSSVTVPSRLAEDGRVIDWLVPALTDGAVLAAADGDLVRRRRLGGRRRRR